MESIIVNQSAIQNLGNIDRKKYLQKLRLLKVLASSEPKSLAEIGKILLLSTPTCLALINDLLNEDILVKSGLGISIGGRKPELYSMRSSALFILSIEMERYETKMAIFDNNNNNLTGIKSFPLVLAKENDPISQLHSFATNLIDASGVDISKLIGIGISMPGLVDANTGNSYTYIISIDKLKTLQQVLEDTFQKPVFIQNDVKSAALAESKFGQAKDKKDVLVVLMDWGIGLGIIMDGELRSGTSGFSGEIGHIPFVENGALCYCGKRGCLETVASGIALAKMAKEGIKSGQYSLLNKLSDIEIDKIEPRVIIDAANRGDQYAIKILADIGTELGKGIATLIQLFNPELIILGGKMAEAKQYITIPMQQSVNTYCMTEIREKAKIVVSELGADAGILGMANTVIEKFLDKQMQLAD